MPSTSTWKRLAQKYKMPPEAADLRFRGPKKQEVFILVTYCTSVQSLGTEATLIFEVQWSKENRLEKEKKKKKEKKKEKEKTTEQKENIYALFHRHR